MKNARQYASHIQADGKLEISDVGVRVRVMDVKEYGGVARMDGETPEVTGRYQPMIFRGAFRLHANRAYRIFTNLTWVKPLPKGVVCRFIPSRAADNAGMMFNQHFLSDEGDVELNVLPFRQLELKAPTPIGFLVFESIEISKKTKPKASDNSREKEAAAATA